MRRPSATTILLVLLLHKVVPLKVLARSPSKHRQLQERSLRAWLANLFSFLLGESTSSCSGTFGCGSGSYCSTSGICQENGSCETEKDCLNPNNEFLSIQCVGSIECNQQRCGVVCDGSIPIAESCNSSSDCNSGKYCGDGKCRDNGTCNKDLDCLNPNNLYALALCIGSVSCSNGICGIDCGSACPGRLQPANCASSPCDSPPNCQEDWEYCINDICNGECGTSLLDAGGREVKCTEL